MPATAQSWLKCPREFSPARRPRVSQNASNQQRKTVRRRDPSTTEAPRFAEHSSAQDDKLLGRLAQHERFHHDVVRLNPNRNHGEQRIFPRLEFFLGRALLDDRDIS
jgi:hypothetical protein